MLSTAPLAFTKMNGLGNAFVILDARGGDAARIASLGRRLVARPRFACDQLIILEDAPDDGDAFMRIYNADGSEAEACGNAARCVAWLLSRETGRADSVIATLGGRLRASVADASRVMVDMGEPRFGWKDIPLAHAVEDTQSLDLAVGPVADRTLTNPSAVNVGNPHAVFFVDDVSAYDLASLGPAVERHALFPRRVNVSLAQVRSRDAIAVRTWERGAGLTQACGTAACASAVAAARRGLTGREVAVTLPGGTLGVRWTEDDRILMTGPIELEDEGAADPGFGA